MNINLTRTPQEPPWRWLPWWLLLGFVLRAVVALSGDFVLHPNEVFQYLEPAHALVFGNGILHWEQYYGARSWLVPGFIAGIMWVCKLLGLGEPAFYLPAVRLVMCAISLLIPFSMYMIGRRLFSEGTARAALLLGVFWYELVGFAHQSLQEFIAVALMMAMLAFVLRPRLSAAQAAAACALGVFIVGLRLQYGPLLMLICFLPFLRGDMRTRAGMVAAAVAMVAAIGVFDMFTWGEFLQSYRLIYFYNAGFDVTRQTLDETAVGDYLIWLGIASGGLVWVALAGAWGSRQRLFVLLLFLAVLLPHETQEREYRFIFAVIPMWLLLCADVLNAGWWRVTAATSQRWRRVLLAWVLVASAAGIANALPWQRSVYLDTRAISEEDGYHPYLARFLRGQDEVLGLYRQLAVDDSVRGVWNAVRRHAFSGGYTFLHHKVPLYDNTVFIPPPRLAQQVSHVIAPPFIKISAEEVHRTSDGGTFILTDGGNIIVPPAYISDETHQQLLFADVDADTQELTVQVVEGFAPVQSSTQYVLWKAVPPVRVRAWTTYRVYLVRAVDHIRLGLGLGREPDKPPMLDGGVQFADDHRPAVSAR